jgi:uncharacterized Zn-finger protein
MIKLNVYLFVVITIATVAGVLAGKMVYAKDTTHEQVVTAAEDLGCTFIEQSYYHPENFYIDCGNDEIRIITKDTK